MGPLWLSMELAGTVAVLLLVIGMPIAYWLAFSAWRGKFLLEALVALPLVLPPNGAGILRAVGHGPRRGRWENYGGLAFGHGLAFTFAGLVIASMFYSFPFAVQPLMNSFEGIDRKLLHASAMLGANPWRTFCRVILPLSRPAMVTAAVLCFAHTLGEFGVVLMVGGNLPGVTRTASIAIYDQVQSLDYGAAHRMALTLLLISFTVLSIVYAVNRRSRSRLWMPWAAN